MVVLLIQSLILCPVQTNLYSLVASRAHSAPISWLRQWCSTRLCLPRLDSYNSLGQGLLLGIALGFYRECVAHLSPTVDTFFHSLCCFNILYSHCIACLSTPLFKNFIHRLRDYPCQWILLQIHWNRHFWTEQNLLRFCSHHSLIGLFQGEFLQKTS